MRSSPHGGDGRPALRLRRHLALVVDIEGITNVDENAHLLNNPVALQLRAMNMLYEGLKERGGLMVVPSSAVESLGMGGLMGAAAMGRAQLAAPEVPPASVDSRA